METLSIHDSSQQLKFVCDDLRAISSVILTAGDHTEYANAYEVLKVIDRALWSIVEDLQGAIDNIDGSLIKLKVQDDQQEKPGVSKIE